MGLNPHRPLLSAVVRRRSGHARRARNEKRPEMAPCLSGSLGFAGRRCAAETSGTRQRPRLGLGYTGILVVHWAGPPPLPGRRRDPDGLRAPAFARRVVVWSAWDYGVFRRARNGLHGRGRARPL